MSLDERKKEIKRIIDYTFICLKQENEFLKNAILKDLYEINFDINELKSVCKESALNNKMPMFSNFISRYKNLEKIERFSKLNKNELLFSTEDKEKLKKCFLENRKQFTFMFYKKLDSDVFLNRFYDEIEVFCIEFSYKNWYKKHSIVKEDVLENKNNLTKKIGENECYQIQMIFEKVI